MSQIKFNALYEGKPAQVMAGWDRQLGYYHLTIFDLDPKAEEEVLWDGLSKHGFCRNLNTIRDTLDDLGITPPPGLYYLVEEREGNVIYVWDASKEIWDRVGW
jgi:hypothetical protein